MLSLAVYVSCYVVFLEIKTWKNKQNIMEVGLRSEDFTRNVPIDGASLPVWQAGPSHPERHVPEKHPPVTELQPEAPSEQRHVLEHESKQPTSA